MIEQLFSMNIPNVPNIPDLRKKCEEAAQFCESTAQTYQTMAKCFQLMASCLKVAEEGNPMALYGVWEKWKEYFCSLAGQREQDKNDSFSAALDKLWF